VLASWTRTIIDALAAQGVDGREVLESAGFGRDAFDDPNARVPVVAMAKLWEMAAERVGDPAFGLRASKYVRSTSFHALGYSVMASSTLEEAVERILQYNRIVSDVASLRLERVGEQAQLQVLLRRGYDSGGQEAIDAVLSLLTRALRMLVGKSFALDRVTMRKSAPADVAPYDRFFRCAVHFGEAVDMLVFDVALLRQHLPAGNPELARVSDAAARDYLARIATGTLADRVRAAIAEELVRKPTPEHIARKLGMSLRSMQRSLQEEGTSYETLTQDVRKQLACSYLKEKRHSITEIAYLLGYENIGAFGRAFRRWTGMSPTEFSG
jgi:AraC-like DNA-binding protein